MRICTCCTPGRFFAAADTGSGSAARPASAGPVDPALIDDLVAANRILADQNVLDAYGHISMRHPTQPGHFLLSRSLAPALVRRADIMEFAADSEPVAGETRAPYLERYIHGEIYRARPDVMAVVHSHSLGVLPFGASQTPVRSMFHMSGFLARGAPVFEARAEFGFTDLLISNNAMGASLGRTLGDAPVALMRGHGYVAVASSVQEAVYRAIYTEVNAQLQDRAQRLEGPIVYLSPEEGAKADETIMKTIGRPWELWKARVTIE